MTLPGWRLRALAARMCESRTMTRLVDPILADLQAEHHEAVVQGSVWRVRLAWLRAIVALARAGAVHSLFERPYEERRHVSRAVVVWAVSFVAFVGLLCAPFAMSLTVFLPWSVFAYIVPSALPIAIPASLVCGMVFGLGQSRHRLHAWIMAVSLAASCASLFFVAAVVPASNQAFREAVMAEQGRAGPLPGVRELTMSQLWRQRTGVTLVRMLPATKRMLVFEIHSRVALAAAPLILVLTVLSVARGRPWLDATVAITLLLCYYGSFRWVDLVYPWPIARAWVPNAICLVLATGSMLLRWERAKRGATA